MNELIELQRKGELAGMGYLKESYDNESNDLKHELTDLGKAKSKELLRDVKYRQAFMLMAIEEAKKHPGKEKDIIKAAMEKIKELQ